MGADHKRMKLPDGERPNTDIEGDQEMETNMAERMYQDDFKWNLDYVEDMCEDEATDDGGLRREHLGGAGPEAG